DLGIRRVTNWGTYWDVPYPEGAMYHMDRLPVWIDLQSPIYGFPDDGDNGIKIALHDAGHTRSTDAAPSSAALEAMLHTAACFFHAPRFRQATCRSLVPCSYDVTPDELFRIGSVPGVTALYFVGGFSG